jgi:hypothetical protein
MSNEQEPGKFELALELVAVQNKLANLSPKAPRIDRDQLMFKAGRAAERAAQLAGDLRVAGNTGRDTYRFWPAATATMTAATILLAAMLFHERQPQSIAHDTKSPATTIASSRGAASDLPFASRTSLSLATSGYLGIRNTALSRGVGALATQFDTDPSVSSPQTKPATARDLRDELLPNTPRQRG